MNLAACTCEWLQNPLRERGFAEIAAHQPEYHAEHISGTIVGFWTPELFHGVSVAGYHLHFLSDDHQFSGHVMDFVMKNGEVEITNDCSIARPRVSLCQIECGRAKGRY